MGYGLMVGRVVLAHVVEVRILLPQPQMSSETCLNSYDNGMKHIGPCVFPSMDSREYFNAHGGERLSHTNASRAVQSSDSDVG